MGDLNLTKIKQILDNASTEIMTVQKEVSRNQGNISDLKIEKLKKLLGESENALTQLKSLHVSFTSDPKVHGSEIQKLIDTILNVRAGSSLNPSVLQAVLSSLQQLSQNLGDIRIDEKDHKRGQKVEKVENDRL